MPRVGQGSIRLFRAVGVDIYLHWSWFVVAIFEIGSRSSRYSSLLWNVAEYLALFSIVLLHEFGHALACRQVGGTADRIMLWPLGGVAYVNPPQRPGATLWSIAAGPLVNVALLPILLAAVWFSRSTGLAATMPDAYQLLFWVLIINGILLGFNILPIYPLDGGQILRSVLWFFMGRARSLMAATVLGMVGGLGFVAYALWRRSPWMLLMAAFMLMSCWSGLKSARALLRSEKLARRFGAACPGCGASPPMGPLWKCTTCGQGFDTFETQAVCPHCGAQYPNTMCVECRQMHPMSEWVAKAFSGVGAGCSSDQQ
jgi:Zn-dependent protease